MADKILIKGGTGEVPKLDVRELGYSKDVKALFIGTEEGNVRLCGADDIAGILTQLDEIKARLSSLGV